MKLHEFAVFALVVRAVSGQKVVFLLIAADWKIIVGCGFEVAFSVQATTEVMLVWWAFDLGSNDADASC